MPHRVFSSSSLDAPAEISQFQLALCANQDVLRLDVAMRDVHAVHVFEGGRELFITATFGSENPRPWASTCLSSAALALLRWRTP